MEGESIFTQLRKLAGVEEEVKRLQELKERGGRGERAGGEGEGMGSGATLLYLIQQSKDLEQLTTSAHSMLRTLKTEGDVITSQLPVFSSFIRRQGEAVSSLENYLTQYGYQPPPRDHPDDEKKKTEEKEEEEKEEEAEAEEQLSPPAPTAHYPALDLNRTPTLEDFGLSQARMNAISREARMLHVTQNDVTASGHVTTSHDVTASQTVSASGSVYWPSRDQKVPPAFHQPVTFTPSVFDGRHLPDMTPDMLAGPAMGYHGARRQPDDMTTNMATPKQNILTQLSSCANDSPPIPEFATPGLNEKLRSVYMKYRTPTCDRPVPGVLMTDSPVPPVPITPGLRHPVMTSHVTMVTTRHTDHVTDVTPEPPVMMTPGLQLVYRRGAENADEGAEKEEPKSTPETPTFLTPHLHLRHRPITATANPAAANPAAANPDTANPAAWSTAYQRDLPATPETPDLTFHHPAFMRHGDVTLYGDVTSFIDQTLLPDKTPSDATLHLKTCGALSDADFMTSPDNTVRFLHSKKADQENNNEMKTGETVTAADSDSVTVTAADSDSVSGVSSQVIHLTLDDLPSPPRLTISKSSLLSRGALPTDTGQRRETGGTRETKETTGETGEAREKETKMGETGDKIETGETGQRCETPDTDVPRIEPLTLEEYDSQPRYIQAQLKLPAINQAISELNVLLTAKARGGFAMFLLEDDLSILDLGRKKNTFCLSLINARRIASGLLNTDRVFTVIPRS